MCDVCEVCSRRLKKRQEAVSAIKRTPAYIVTVQMRGNNRAKTPDPDDLRVNKRPWEFSVMRWRQSLRDSLREIHMMQEMSNEEREIHMMQEMSNEEAPSDES